MGRVISSASTTLDGYIAYPDHTVGPIFDWYDNGTTEVPTAIDGWSMHMTAESAAYWSSWTSEMGALLVGRALFDVTDGWKGNHPLGVPVVVLTHTAPTDWHYPGEENFTFVTTGIEDAVAAAQQIAGPRVVAAAAGTIARQCLEAGLLDAVAIDLVPVVIGRGRPYFGEFADGRTRLLSNPITCVQGDRATHLVFDVIGVADDDQSTN